MVASVAVVALLIVSYGVGRLIESRVTGTLFRMSRRRVLQRSVAEREAQVLFDAVRVKRLLDQQAFAAQQEMLQAAREHSNG